MNTADVEETMSTVDDAGVQDHGDAQDRVGPGPTLVLTAQELTVLEQAHAAGLGTALTASGEEQEEDGQPEQLAQARWSLTARGLLTLDGGLPEGTDLGLLVQTFLDVRAGAAALVVVERLMGEGRRDLRLLHLLPEGGVVEDVHPEGLHGFDLALTGADLVEAVTTMVVPGEAEPGQGQDLTVEDVSLLPVLLHHPTVLAELTVVDETGERGHLAALGPGGCWAGPRPDGPEPLRLAPVGPGWVEEVVTGWVHATVRPASAGTMAP